MRDKWSEYEKIIYFMLVYYYRDLSAGTNLLMGHYVSKGKNAGIHFNFADNYNANRRRVFD